MQSDYLFTTFYLNILILVTTICNLNFFYSLLTRLLKDTKFLN